MNNKSIIAFALAASFGVYASGSNISITPEMMKSAQDAVKSQGEKLTDFDIQHAEEMARKISDYSSSTDFRMKQKALKSQVYKTAGLDENNDSEKGPELVSDQVVLFVSSSMPIQTLRNYARDLAKVNGVMVLRGAVGGISKIGATMKLTHDALRADPTCEGANCKMWGTQMLIDPVIFRVYGINQVPALIYQPNMHIQSYCDGLENINRASSVIYGDASLKGMLNRMNQLNPDEKVQALIKKLDKA
ncbi:type-F conjugative transfer system pilin assembly protein TrbC [Pantoea eucalypti]|uniref:type-F conjugative transfer system pilin assembly protein TrbC n=1 Tax=Pantoea TaxID=53335 RepID=UPI000B7F3700|nr:type-F conjugative transfer system pilin assembly protein TrbC [Pantoea ananatis]